MTTVCFDGTLLAADTLYVNGSKKLQGHYEKIHLPGDKTWTVDGKTILVMGLSGTIAVLPSVKRALEAGVIPGIDYEGLNGDSFNAFLITDTKQNYYWNYGTTSKGDLINELFPIEGNHAIGSGGIYGLGIMAIKGNAIDGVRGAIKVDLHTGGYIDVWSLEDPKQIVRIDPEPLTQEQAKVRAENGGSILCASGD